MKKLTNDENGITLVELLATIVLISIVGALAYSLLSQGYSNYQRVNAESEMRDEADIIMSTLVKDLFSARSSEVQLTNSCSSNGFATTQLTISKKNLPVKKIIFKPSSINGNEGMVMINNLPINFSDNVSISLYPCTSNAYNITTDDQVSYTIQFQLEVEKNNDKHSMDFENTFNLISN
ncbi:type II secretion system protein J [Planococcus rifietoensis]|uniref:PulJ/GspJ family protein n=1 Tax=Planococcus rifietoensis TaxID=200991 RepID=UPI00384FBB08